MPPRLSDRDLLLLVLTAIQEHTQSLRTCLDGVDAALSSAGADSAEAPESAQLGFEAVRFALHQTGLEAGEIQTILAAAAQVHYSALVAEARAAMFGARRDARASPDT